MSDLATARAHENFPVGSRLIRRDLRPAVLAFYAVARGADDVADDPDLPADEKLARLDRVEAGLLARPNGAPEGLALRDALSQAGRPGGLGHARRLLDAFRFDARGGEVATWDDLLAYCDDSADPVGRFLLDLHGEGSEGVPASDALCTALQVLNHLQDIKADHLRLRRRYLPGDWMAQEGAGAGDLAAPALTPALARVVHRALDACDALLAEAAALPRLLLSRRLAGEAAAILRLAQALAARLRREDPLAARVAPSRADFARAGLWGAWTALAPRRPMPWPAAEPRA
jgi:squalene synthase HpnC